MKKKIIIFVIVTLMASAILIVVYCTIPFSRNFLNLLNILSIFFSLSALVFAFLASLWAYESKIVLSSYFRDYLSLSNEERDIFCNFVKHSSFGKKDIDKSEFLKMVKKEEDAEYYLKGLINKGWIRKKQRALSVSGERMLLVEQLKGEKR